MLETRAVKMKFGKWTFSYIGLKVWNALSLDAREADNIGNFKQKVKTLLFEGKIKFVGHAFITTWIFMIIAHLSSSEFHSENALYKYNIIIIVIIIFTRFSIFCKKILISQKMFWNEVGD